MRRLCNGHVAQPTSLQLGRINKSSSVSLLKSCSAHFMPQVTAFFSTLALRTSFADPAHTESEDASPVLALIVLRNNQTSSTAAVNKHWSQRAHVTETRHALAVAAKVATCELVNRQLQCHPGAAQEISIPVILSATLPTCPRQRLQVSGSEQSQSV